MTEKPSDIAEKMVLGTAQFGMDYGIANVSGKPAKQDVFDILELAWESGVRCFDTAPTYKSETLLGQFISTNGLGDKVKVLTKIPSLDGLSDYETIIIKSTELSLKNLGCPIDVLFFHNPNDSMLLLKAPEFFDGLLHDYPISSLGVSVYEPNDIEKLSGCPLELAFQFPFNVLDRRFEKVKMPVGKRYARSIFLQGLLVSKNILRPNTNLDLIDLHTKFHNKVSKYNINPIDFALSFVANSKTADYVLFGVDNIDHLNDYFSKDLNDKKIIKFLNEFVMTVDNKLLDPRLWN